MGKPKKKDNDAVLRLARIEKPPHHHSMRPSLAIDYGIGLVVLPPQLRRHNYDFNLRGTDQLLSLYRN